MSDREPDRTTVVSLAWIVGVGAVFLLALLALVLRTGLDALGRSRTAVLAASAALALVIVVKLWTRKS